MSDTAPPAPHPAPTPLVRRIRRWPTAVVTFLLTSQLSIFVAWYVLYNVLPTQLPKQEWWVRQDPKTMADSRARGAYIESVLYSKLSAGSKLNLIDEAVDRESPGSHSSNPKGAWDAYLGSGRFPYLREPLVELVIGILENPNAGPESHLKALRLFNRVVAWAARTKWPEKPSALDYELDRDRQAARLDLANATPHLVHFLASPGVSTEHRREAVRAFAGIGRPWDRDRDCDPHSFAPEQVFPAAELIVCLSDPDKQVRWSAARALGYAPEADRAAVIPALLKQFSAVNTTDSLRSDGDSWYWGSEAVRIEVVRSLGMLGPIPGHDPRPALVAHLNTPRVPLTASTDSERHNDTAVRTQIIQVLDWMPTTSDGSRAVLATLRGWKAVSWPFDYAALAAACSLGKMTSWDEAGSALLMAFREELSHHQKNLKVHDRAWFEFVHLFTYAQALLEHRETARTAVSDLIRILPAVRTGEHQFAFQPQMQSRPWYSERAFPPLPSDFSFRDLHNSPYGNIPDRRDWLTKALERLGPPAKSDLKALRELLDYDGKNEVTKGGDVFEVRHEAAKALLRDAVAGAKDRRAALEAVRDDPANHPALVTQAEVELKKLVGE